MCSGRGYGGGLYSDRSESEWRDPPYVVARGDVEKTAKRSPSRRRSRSPRRDQKKQSPDSSTGNRDTKSMSGRSRDRPSRGEGTRHSAARECNSRSSRWTRLRRTSSEGHRQYSPRGRSQSPVGATRDSRHNWRRKRSRSISDSRTRYVRSPSGHYRASPSRLSSSCSSGRVQSGSTSTTSRSTSPSSTSSGECSDEEEDHVPKSKMEFNCEVCGISTNSFSVLQIHFAGLKHSKNLRKFGYSDTFKMRHEVHDPQLSGKILRCLLCDVMLTEAEIGLHVGCRTHISALEREGERFSTMDPDKLFVEVEKTASKSRRGYVCKLCEVTLADYNGFRTHLQGKRHIKAVKLADSTHNQSDANNYWCNICNIYANSEEALDTHLKGKKHHRTLKHKGFVKEEPTPSEDLEPTTSSCVVANPYAEAVLPSKIRCVLCDVVLSNNTEIHAHLATTEHYVALRKTPWPVSKKRSEMFVAEPA